MRNPIRHHILLLLRILRPRRLRGLFVLPQSLLFWPRPLTLLLIASPCLPDQSRWIFLACTHSTKPSEPSCFPRHLLHPLTFLGALLAAKVGDGRHYDSVVGGISWFKLPYVVFCEVLGGVHCLNLRILLSIMPWFLRRLGKCAGADGTSFTRLLLEKLILLYYASDTLKWRFLCLLRIPFEIGDSLLQDIDIFALIHFLAQYCLMK